MEQDKNTNDEVHLGDLMQAIKNGFYKIGFAFVRLMAFFLRHAIALVLLIIIGGVVGFFKESNSPTTFQTNYTIANYYASGDFLQQQVEELNFAIKSHDSTYLKKAGIPTDEGLVKLELEPVVGEKKFDRQTESFYRTVTENNFVDEEELSAMFKNNFDKQRLSLYHSGEVDGQRILSRILKHISQNKFYTNYSEQRHEDVEDQIASNKFLIRQVDSLVKNYSSNLASNQTALPGSRQDNILDLGSVLENRIEIQKRNEKLIEKKVAGEKFLNVLDKGRPIPAANASFISNALILIPVLLIFGYLVVLLFIKLVKEGLRYNKENHGKS